MSQMREQANLAIAMADVILFLTDIKQGVTAADREISIMLKKSGKPIVLVCNKADNFQKDKEEAYEFYNLGMGDPYPISATNALGIGDVLDKIYESFPENIEENKDENIIKVAVIGKPNVGKSSLINKILGENRAIVSDIAGTTRDVLEEQINLNGITLNVMDTAGIRDTEDVVEKIGVDRARTYASKADLVIYVIDASTELDESDYEIMDLLQDKKAIVLLNKSDLDTKVTVEEVQHILDKKIIPISAKEHQGIDELEETIRNMFFQGEVTFNDEVYAINMRQKTSLQVALDHLHQVIQSIEDDMPEDFYSIDLMGAYEELGKIIGEAVEDDLVDEIFSKFCMGK